MLWGLGLQDGAPLCVSVPAGWPGAVCPADAHPHPDHRVCAQPDDGLQPSLQPEPEAVSTPCSEPIPAGWVLGSWALCFSCCFCALSPPAPAPWCLTPQGRPKCFQAGLGVEGAVRGCSLA